ncbi:MAG: hypothetical protein H7X86_07120, partial [Gorillibacterium sp.]|nr:hypothetical protein [Gorillibacterium sp.]
MGYRLESDKLQVDIAELDYYPGQRFDHTGFITQVRLQTSEHTFCVQESPIPGEGTGGEGLCNEFGLFTSIGYEDAAVGECFPKLGVGNLTKKEDAKYHQFQEFAVEPFHTEIESSKDRIRYTVHPKECRGYAVRQEKIISVKGATLTVEYRLDNVGSKRIETDEYIHNFLRVDDHAIGPDYVLMFPASLQLIDPQPELIKDLNIQDNVVRWITIPTECFYAKMKGFPQG